MSKLVIASTTAAWKCNGKEELAWLRNAEALIRHSPLPVEFFCAVEVDGRGDAPFKALLDNLRLLDSCDIPTTVWRFSLDDGTDVVTTRDRLVRICMGRNLAHEYASNRTDASHILFLDTDTLADDDCIPKLLELDHPVVGGHVGEYGLDGPKVYIPEGGPKRDLIESLDVRAHWNTAGFLLLQREVFRKVRWRWDLEAGQSDDPAFQHDTEHAWGWGPTWVRRDVLGRHIAPLVPVEERTHLDRTVYR